MSHLTKAQLIGMPLDKIFQEYLTEYVQSKAALPPASPTIQRSPVKTLYGKKNGSGSALHKMRPANNTGVHDLVKKERSAERAILSPRMSLRKQGNAHPASSSADPAPLGTELVRKSPRLLNRSPKVWSMSTKSTGLSNRSPARLVAGMRTSTSGSQSGPGVKSPRKRISTTSDQTASGSATRVNNRGGVIELTDRSDKSEIICISGSPLKKKRRTVLSGKTRVVRDPVMVAKIRAALAQTSSDDDSDAIIVKPKKKLPRAPSPKVVEGSVDGEEEVTGVKYAYVRVASGETYYGQIVNPTPSP